GAVDSDFGLDNAAGLAFAARATSSIPGAFPPARVLELDELVAARAAQWSGRDDFLARNFEPYAATDTDASDVPFVAGSVLNSRPSRAAITAIRGRPAYREVDRRVVYVDPNPTAADATPRHGMPGFFATLRGSLSQIPLSEPVTDELGYIAQLNERARRLRGIIESARQHISQLVAEVTDGSDGAPVTEERIRGWREQSNSKAARDAGFACES